jgi:hypothetical protein
LLARTGFDAVGTPPDEPSPPQLARSEITVASPTPRFIFNIRGGYCNRTYEVNRIEITARVDSSFQTRSGRFHQKGTSSHAPPGYKEVASAYSPHRRAAERHRLDCLEAEIAAQSARAALLAEDLIERASFRRLVAAVVGGTVINEAVLAKQAKVAIMGAPDDTIEQVLGR